MVEYEDTAWSLYQKMVKTALEQLRELLPILERNELIGVPQDESIANSWRKRRKPDGCIDFRMTSRAIYNLVRALSRPYIGAHMNVEDREVKVWQAKEVPESRANIEPGRVLNVSSEGVLVKCYDKAILLQEFDEKAYKPRVGDCL